MEPKVNIALEAARAGCKELLSFAYRLDQLEIKEKGPSNFVTQLDKRVESIIIDSLKSIYPRHTYVSEEVGRIEGSGKDINHDVRQQLVFGVDAFNVTVCQIRPAMHFFKYPRSHTDWAIHHGITQCLRFCCLLSPITILNDLIFFKLLRPSYFFCPLGSVFVSHGQDIDMDRGT